MAHRLGIGVNATNPSPTTSLSALLPAGVPAFTLEKLLARILTSFEALYTAFLAAGKFSADLKARYERDWLHTGQMVTVDGHGRGRIVGLEAEYGQLEVEEVGWGDVSTGKRWVVGADGNGFDFLRGLVKRKG